MSYEPKPLDTSKIELTPDVLALTELLARNTHDVWAQQRLREGWRWGARRDDERKEHPLLVPYEQLSEADKQYDRNTALETLKAILALGYRLIPPTDATAPPTGKDGPAGLEPPVDEGQPAHANGATQAATSEPAALPGLLAEIAHAPLPALLSLWQARDAAWWATQPAAARALGTRALKLGEPIFAYDVVTDALQHWPADVRLRQLQALALARSGARERASSLLTRLSEEGHSDEETLGMLARTYKDLWQQAANSQTDAPAGTTELRHARDAYLQAYKLSGGYWTAINAATLSLLLDETELARQLAREVRAACLPALEDKRQADDERYWPLATLGEAELILDDLAAAHSHYCAAAEIGSYGEIASTRRNARLIINHLRLAGASIEQCLSVPRVVVCAGHMIDRPGRAPARFPPQLEASVRAELRARLQALEAGIGYSSAACGTDILFLETLHELGGETNIVLPYEREQFITDSVLVAGDDSWRVRFARALERAASVAVASEQKIGDGSLSYEYCNQMLQGLGGMRAEQLATGLVPLAVWDGRAGDGRGGTAGFVAQWRAQGYEVDVIDTNALLLRAAAANAPQTPARAEAPMPAAGAAARSDSKVHARSSAGVETADEFTPQIKALLFADAVHFSRLTEAQIPLFLSHFLAPIGQLCERPEYRPDFKNTWGDGLYFAFDSVLRAGRFALEVCDLLNSTDWTAQGLPADLNLRIALHAGPVYACTDPITRSRNYTGTHVSRAARIEPITPPGQVYASRAFAALAYAQAARAFICEYVGQTPLAKGYGTFPTYLVRRR